LGGGVIGDLAGFVASIYQRGIDFWQIPTTLLAMVDSSVGGKTAVNHPRGKNLIGAFHQPKAVFADLARLATLPARELSAGLAEVIKYGLLGDAAFFAELEQRLPALLAQDPTALAETVAHCCRMKAAIVARDERETGERALLNLGHTFGHAVEAFTHYQSWLHGEAVGLGLLMAADISWRMGQLPEADKQRTFAAVQAAGLPVLAPQGMTAAHFWHYMAGDKKVAAGKIRFIVLQRLGQAEIRADIPQSLLQQTLEQFTRQTS
jgi:3-dehydroquinate synthase